MKWITTKYHIDPTIDITISDDQILMAMSHRMVTYVHGYAQTNGTYVHGHAPTNGTYVHGQPPMRVGI